ncbi:hypothetical protein F7D01_10720 [Erythrobacter sp. 3-20A1M]|uniref:ubiquinol-cytochrome C chaperone family protein n=1 Tax=Erythrobacter sp. 3-20A1M TaxID=2653850 RepID=UPI001BFCD3C6|nr:ubiquinol-cytochrome C chaperone family protein [Erythrobacter sp. 3-20A1M]QWC57491.1 hypothetical protein F7D01_10720 [Erythrobacter sp. 3-20A1M]
MSFLSRLLGLERDPREALRPLWHRVVAEARDPHWYAECRVADTLDGRFDMVSSVLAIAMLRTEQGDAHAQDAARLAELFVEDMEGQLREAGFGDPAVGKRVGRLMSALGGRMGAYRSALTERNDEAMTAAAARNVTFVEEGGSPACVARGLMALADRLSALDYASVLKADW